MEIAGRCQVGPAGGVTWREQTAGVTMEGGEQRGREGNKEGGREGGVKSKHWPNRRWLS